jgi:hypothetical protein
LAGLGVLVAAPAFAVVALMGLSPKGGHDQNLSPNTDPRPRDTGSATSTIFAAQDESIETTVAAVTLTDLGGVSADQATTLLQRTDDSEVGNIEKAWTWTDRNGLNLLTLSSSTPDGADPESSSTLQVTQVADLDGAPQRLRVMSDPLTCAEGTALDTGFTDGSVQISDLDGNGVAEASIGWYGSCEGSEPSAMVKLALISDGRKFILRGNGRLATQTPNAPATEGFEAEPPRDSWPKPFYTTAESLYHLVYR